jgi:hydroxymethylglutaryl-CoA lyase
LLKVGFDVIDFGSFVSPKAIPQLKDTREVLEGLDLDESSSELLSVVGNVRGGNDAASFEKISLIGFPHSISDKFLQLNINSNIQKSRDTVKELLEICDRNNKELMVYISMAYGNPYDEEWHPSKLADESNFLYEAGVRHIALSDTIGVGNEDTIGSSFAELVPALPDVEFSLHLHTTIENWYGKIDAAFRNGCRNFDGVLNGLGGCPMADHELVGNIYTGFLLEYMVRNNIELSIDRKAFEDAITKSITTFALIDFEIPESY